MLTDLIEKIMLNLVCIKTEMHSVYVSVLKYFHILEL